MELKQKVMRLFNHVDYLLNHKQCSMKFILLLFAIISFNFAVGQRTAVDRNTGRVITCDEMGCSNTDSTYEMTDRNCLNCLMRLSDSTMESEKNKILQKCNTQKAGCKSFIKEQNTWATKCEKNASKEGDKYKGGTMEMTEYVRFKLIETNKRISYLRNYLKALDNP